MRRKRLLINIGLTVFLIAILFISCAPAKSARKVEQKIHVPLISACTGWSATTIAPYCFGALDYFKYVNEQGGIKYRTAEGKEGYVKIDMPWEETAFDPARTIDAYKRLVKPKTAALVVYASSAGDILCPFYKKDRIATTGYQYQVPIALELGEPYYWFPENGYGFVGQEAGFIDWLEKEWMPKHWKEARPLRVAFIVPETVTSRAQHPGGLPAYIAEKRNFEFIDMVFQSSVVADASVELSRFDAAGADWIYLSNVTTAVATNLKDAVRLGIKDKINWAVTTYGYDPLLAKLAGIDVVEGVYGQMMTPQYYEDIPGVKFCNELAAKYRPEMVGSTLYYEGVTVPIVLEEALRIALETVGYENMSGEAVREAYMSIKDFDPMGLCPPVTIKIPDRDMPGINPWFRMGIFESGKIQVISHWTWGPGVYSAASN